MNRIARSSLLAAMFVAVVPVTFAFAAPSTAPAPTARVAARPATQPTVPELHDAAIEQFRAGKRIEASALIEKAYAAASAEERTRPLVLNRAVIDLMQRTFVMRAVRELSAYLRDHPEPDEQAHDILGAALNIAADNPRWKQGPVWQSAYTEWSRRDEQMNASRPGFHRWGPLWLNEAQFAQMQSDRADTERAIDEQSRRVDDAQTRLDAINGRDRALRQTVQDAFDQAQGIWDMQQQAAQQRDNYDRAMQSYEQQKARYDAWVKAQANAPKPVAGAGGNTHAPPVPVAPPAWATATPPAAAGGAGSTPNVRNRIGLRNPNNDPSSSYGVEAVPGLVEERARIAGEAAVAPRAGRAEQTQLASLKAQANVRPPWPKTFEMIDPSELKPPPPAPPDPDAVARLVELTKREAPVGAGGSPFANSGQQRRRPGDDAANPNAPMLPRRGGGGGGVAPPAVAPAAGMPPTTAPGAGDATGAQVPFGPRSIDR